MKMMFRRLMYVLIQILMCSIIIPVALVGVPLWVLTGNETVLAVLAYFDKLGARVLKGGNDA